MKTSVYTTHSITIDPDGDDDFFVGAKVDRDNEVRLLFDAIFDYEGNKATVWMNRKNLTKVRAVINRALDIIP